MKLVLHKGSVYVKAETSEDMVELITKYGGHGFVTQKPKKTYTYSATPKPKRRVHMKKACPVCGDYKKNLGSHMKEAHGMRWLTHPANPAYKGVKVQVRSHPELIDA